MSLKALIDEYLRGCEDWREHPEHIGSYLHWEDLRAGSDDYRTLPTAMAALRQMGYEHAELRVKP